MGGGRWLCGGALPASVKHRRQPLCLLLQMETVKQGVDQKLVEGQEKLHQMWLRWNQRQLHGTEGGPAKPEVSVWVRGVMGCLGP